MARSVTCTYPVLVEGIQETAHPSGRVMLHNSHARALRALADEIDLIVERDGADDRCIALLFHIPAAALAAGLFDKVRGPERLDAVREFTRLTVEQVAPSLGIHAQRRYIQGSVCGDVSLLDGLDLTTLETMFRDNFWLVPAAEIFGESSVTDPGRLDRSFAEHLADRDTDIDLLEPERDFVLVPVRVPDDLRDIVEATDLRQDVSPAGVVIDLDEPREITEREFAAWIEEFAREFPHDHARLLGRRPLTFADADHAPTGALISALHAYVPDGVVTVSGVHLSAAAIERGLDLAGQLEPWDLWGVLKHPARVTQLILELSL